MTAAKRKKMRRCIRSQRRGNNQSFIILVHRTRVTKELMMPWRNLPTKERSTKGVLQVPRRGPPGGRRRDLFVARVANRNTIGYNYYSMGGDIG